MQRINGEVTPPQRSVLYGRIAVFSLAAIVLACGQREPRAFAPDGSAVLGARKVLAPGVCSLDTVDKRGVSGDTFRAKAGGQALFSGWAWHPERAKPSDFLVVRLVEIESGTANFAYTSSRGQRQDVAASLRLPDNAPVGFELAAIDLPKTKGTYAIEMIQSWSDATAPCPVIKARLVLD